MSKKEKWADVPGFPGYSVSTLGRVVSRLGRKPRFLAPGIRTGYPSVILRRGNVSHNRRVHRLVLRAFVGDPKNGQEAAHADGDRRNARLDNLRWATAEENQADKIIHGTTNRGERCGSAKLTERDVLEILRRYPAEMQKHLAKEYGVKKQCISAIVCGRTWKHVDRSKV